MYSDFNKYFCYLGFGLFTGPRRCWTFQNFAYFRIIIDIQFILYSLYTACWSKYCIYIFWKRPGSARYRVPRRPLPVWNLSVWAFCTNLPSDCYFPCFQFSKALYSLSQLESINLLYLLGRGLLAESTGSHDAQNNKISKSFLKCNGKSSRRIQHTWRVLKFRSRTRQQNPEVFFQPHQAQVVPNMFKPYIEGSKVVWTVNDGLYHRFLKWCLKCENILECELVMLSERRQCKKVIAWSGDFGISTVSNWQQLLPKLVTSKEQILQSYSCVSEGIRCFPGPHTTYSWIQVLHQSRPLVDQSWCTGKKLLNKRLTRCWKWEFRHQNIKPPHGLTALCLVRGRQDW